MAIPFSPNLQTFSVAVKILNGDMSEKDTGNHILSILSVSRKSELASTNIIHLY